MYSSRLGSAAQVVAELVELAKHLKSQHDREAQSGLTEDEMAFYDAMSTNDSAVLELGDEKLKAIAHDLVGIVRRDAKAGWNVKEQVRAKLRTTIKRLLRVHGYPPDKADGANDLIIQQAEVIAADWATTGSED